MYPFNSSAISLWTLVERTRIRDAKDCKDIARRRTAESSGAQRLGDGEGSADAASRGSSDLDETTQRHHRGVFEKRREYVTE